MKYIKTITILFVMICLTACGIKTVTPNLFVTSERMIVTYSSQGCFHHRSNILVFHENNVTIYKTMNEWNKKVAKTKMGTLVLTKKDKERLNKLFAYYDGKFSNGCTTIDEIEIKRYKNEKLISSKKIIDASCGLYQRKDVLSFPELVDRVMKKEIANEKI